MSKRNPNRPMKGDWVRIDHPEMFVRCGYPLSIKEVRKQIEKDHRNEIEDFVDKVARGAPSDEDGENWLTRRSILSRSRIMSRSVRQIVDALAYERIKAQGFGGRERKVYTEYVEAMKGKVFKIESTKTCMTGEYYDSSGGYDSWSGEYDYEPGGLMNQKCHRILQLGIEGYGI
jgi:hypothetical protein